MYEIVDNIEFLKPKEIEIFQLKKLQELLIYLQNNSVYYQNIFEKNNIDITKIKSLEDLNIFPFTEKEDLAIFNDDFLCVSKEMVADYVTTSGTISDPVTFYLTHQDIDRLAYNESKSLQCAGGTSKDVFQLMTTIDKRFMAGLAYLNGVLKLKAGIVRVGPGSPYLQWDSILRFKPKFLIAIPSFIPKLIDYAIKNNIDYKNTGVKSIICIGESLRDKDLALSELGKRIKSLWNVDLYSTYASTEMGAAFTECEHGKGGHLRPELLILEVVDTNGRAVPSGTQGEVVVTTLGVEGMPLLRYKTGDICKVYKEKCLCGRTTTRLGPIIGRKKQMLKYKGTTIFPPAIFDVLDVVEVIDLYQLEIKHDEFLNDDICVYLPEDIFGKKFERDIVSLFRSKLRVVPTLCYIDRAKLKLKVFNQEKRKPTKIVDLRI